MPYDEPAAAVAEAQRRLVLALRAHHGPRLPAVWASACSAAGVLAAGRLTLDELDAVAGVLLGGGGVDAVAAGSCRVRLVFVRGRPAAVPAPRAEDEREPLRPADVRTALHEPDALDEQTWRRRLAELEREFAPPGESPATGWPDARAHRDVPTRRT